jgi:hypothetical protein
VLDMAKATATALAAKPRNALLETKKLVRGNTDEIEGRMETEGAVFAKQLASPEAQQAFAAFFKRKG